MKTLRALRTCEEIYEDLVGYRHHLAHRLHVSDFLYHSRGEDRSSRSKHEDYLGGADVHDGDVCGASVLVPLHLARTANCELRPRTDLSGHAIMKNSESKDRTFLDGRVSVLVG